MPGANSTERSSSGAGAHSVGGKAESHSQRSQSTPPVSSDTSSDEVLPLPSPTIPAAKSSAAPVTGKARKSTHRKPRKYLRLPPGLPVPESRIPYSSVEFSPDSDDLENDAECQAIAKALKQTQIGLVSLLFAKQLSYLLVS